MHSEYIVLNTKANRSKVHYQKQGPTEEHLQASARPWVEQVSS